MTGKPDPWFTYPMTNHAPTTSITWTSRKAFGGNEYDAVIGGIEITVRRTGSSRPTVCGRWQAVARWGVTSRRIATAQTLGDCKRYAEQAVFAGRVEA